jgi:hypothetical protein
MVNTIIECLDLLEKCVRDLVQETKVQYRREFMVRLNDIRSMIEKVKELEQTECLKLVI